MQFGFETTSEYLEKHTRQYWRISLIWEGKSDEKTTTGKVLTELGKLLDNLSPERALVPKATKLKDDLIQGGRHKKPKPLQNVIQLKAK